MNELQQKQTITRSYSNELGKSGVNYDIYKTLNRYRKKNPPSTSKNPFKSTSKKTAAAAAVNGAAASKSNSKWDKKPETIDE